MRCLSEHVRIKGEATYGKNGAEDAKAPCEKDIICPAPIEVLQNIEENINQDMADQ
jgi:hypothetical protein